MRDEFLSEEDLDLRTMTDEELHACWDLWLLEAQATNNLDRGTCSHGVFVYAPGAAPNVARQTGATRGPAGDG